MLTEPQLYPISLYLGGTFNPIHYGHLHPIIELADQLQANQINLLPNGHPPHKQHLKKLTPHRANMCHLACEIDDRLKVDKRELTPPTPNFTINTLKQLRAEQPAQSIVFVIGVDSFNSLHTWFEWSLLTDYAHIVVLKRGACKVAATPEVNTFIKDKITDKVLDLSLKKQGLFYFSQTSELQISSTLIRKRTQLGLNCRCLLPESVNNYIIENQIYLNTP